MADALRSVDFVARLAEAWDGKGRHPFNPAYEHCCLLQIAGLPLRLALFRWRDLSEEHRQMLLVAGRKGVEFGRACAWCFGEGEGARS